QLPAKLACSLTYGALERATSHITEHIAILAAGFSRLRHFRFGSLFGTLKQDFVGRLAVEGFVVTSSQGRARNQFVSGLLIERTNLRLRRCDFHVLHHGGSTAAFPDTAGELSEP